MGRKATKSTVEKYGNKNETENRKKRKNENEKTKMKKQEEPVIAPRGWQDEAGIINRGWAASGRGKKKTPRYLPE